MIDQELIDFFKNQIESKSFRSGVSVEDSYEEIKSDHIKFYGNQEDKLKAIDLAFIELKRQRSGIRSLKFASTISKKNQQEWYLSPDENIDLNWFAFKKYLSVSKSWSDEEINSVDESSTKVVNQILSPASEKEKRFQGLVLGYVQSGKTSNMAATIAKAADRGYKLIIILAGLTDSLRKQTQIRMQKDLGQHLQDRWYFCTDEENDFTSYTELPTWDNERKTTILIIKKNVFILKRLLKKIKNQSEVKRKGMTTLIVDDECDQASLNTKAYREQVSQTNKYIRQILENLRKVTYLGYTATPYANILTPQKSVDGKLDLYPNDFIVSLDEPKNYFGARKLFGDEFDVDNDNELPFIRRVKGDEIENLQPPSQKARFDFTPSLTQSLVDSCDYYLLCLCAKTLRGQGRDHCCMLIHTTIYSETHKDLKNLLLKEWLNPLIKNIENGDEFTLNRLKFLWEKESKVLDTNFRNKLSCPECIESFSDIKDLILKEAKSIELVIENSTVNSKDRLDFDTDKNIHAIVIGGNTLRTDNPLLTSRGNKQVEPLRVVFTKSLNLPEKCNLWDLNYAKTIVVFDGSSADESYLKRIPSEIDVEKLSSSSPHLLSKLLAEKGCNSILWECGANLATAAIKEGCIQECITFIAPKILGGENAMTPFSDLKFSNMKQVINLNNTKIERFMNDFCFRNNLS